MLLTIKIKILPGGVDLLSSLEAELENSGETEHFSKIERAKYLDRVLDIIPNSVRKRPMHLRLIPKLLKKLHNHHHHKQQQ